MGGGASEERRGWLGDKFSALTVPPRPTNEQIKDCGSRQGTLWIRFLAKTLDLFALERAVGVDVEARYGPSLHKSEAAQGVAIAAIPDTDCLIRTFAQPD